MKKGIISVLSALAGIAVGAAAVGKIASAKSEKIQALSEKHLALFLMMNQWVKAKQEGKNLASYFDKNGYRKIAIYGMSYAGETLLGELKGTGVQVAYAIDRNASAIYADIDVLPLDSDLGDVDAVVVTAITFFDELKEKLGKRLNCPVVSLENIVFEI